MLSKKILVNFCLILFYKFVLEISYIFYISPIYGYYGFPLNLNILKSIESYIFITFLYILLPKKGIKPSDLIIQFLFLVIITPLLSLYYLKDESRIFTYLCIFGFFITILTAKLFPKLKITKIENSNMIIYIICLIITTITYGYLLIRNGLPSLTALNLNKVLIIRERLRNITPIMTYFITWQAKVINSFFIGIFYYYKENFKMFIFLLVQFLLFLLTGHKTYLFSPVLVIGTIYLTKRNNFMKGVLMGLIWSNIIGLIVALTGLSNWIIRLLTFRVIFLPAQIAFNYYDFFSQNKLLYLAEGIIGKLFAIKSPYNIPVFHMIGDIYFNSPTTNVNTGYLSDAYMNFGEFGIVFYSFIFGIILLLIDSISSKGNIFITMSAIIFPIYSLVDNGLLTTLLTNGLILSVVLIYVFRISKYSDNNLENNVVKIH